MEEELPVSWVGKARVYKQRLKVLEEENQKLKGDVELLMSLVHGARDPCDCKQCWWSRHTWLDQFTRDVSEFELKQIQAKMHQKWEKEAEERRRKSRVIAREIKK